MWNKIICITAISKKSSVTYTVLSILYKLPDVNFILTNYIHFTRTFQRYPYMLTITGSNSTLNSQYLFWASEITTGLWIDFFFYFSLFFCVAYCSSFRCLYTYMKWLCLLMFFLRLLITRWFHKFLFQVQINRIVLCLIKTRGRQEKKLKSVCLFLYRFYKDTLSPAYVSRNVDEIVLTSIDTHDYQSVLKVPEHKNMYSM